MITVSYNICYQKQCVVWFARKINFYDFIKNVVYYSYLGDDKKIYRFFFVKKKSYTLFNEISLSEEEIWKNIENNTRNEIRRASKEGCEYITDISPVPFRSKKG